MIVRHSHPDDIDAHTCFLSAESVVIHSNDKQYKSETRPRYDECTFVNKIRLSFGGDLVFTFRNNAKAGSRERIGSIRGRRRRRRGV